MRPLIIAHRGASNLAPENTLASFRLAKELGADGFECDVQLTKDHKLVIAHDFFTDAHTGVKGDIYDMTFDELRQLDFGKWKSPEYEGEKIPTIEEVLDIGKDMKMMHIELKPYLDRDADFPERVIDAVVNAHMEDKVILTSFQYGLLGRNKADDDRVKLFPRDAKSVAEAIGQAMCDATGKRIEAMVYGDGAFKDPAGKIWELADPVVAPGYTAGLVGTPNELKLKYLADKDFADLKGEALQKAISEKIKAKDARQSLVGSMVSEGTTPRNLTDLIGSLCDLTSGSGDKGTPIVYIQGYFDNYTID